MDTARLPSTGAWTRASPRGCPACAGSHLRPGFVAAGFSLIRCTSCRSLFVDPPPAEATLRDLYADREDFEYGPEEQRRLRRQANHRARRLDELGARSVLEIGCANGYFLDALTERGMSGDGVEPGVAGSEAQARGHRVHRCWVQDLQPTEPRFDAVALWEVVEHVPEPLPIIQKLMGFLRPTGIVALSTPSLSGLPARLLGRRFPMIMPPRHLTLFTRPGLRRLLDRAGLEVLRWDSFSSLGPRQLAAGARRFLLGDSAPARAAAHAFGLAGWLPARAMDALGLGTEFEVYARRRS